MYRDIRFEFRYENPFSNDFNKSALTKLKKYMDDNPNTFSNPNYKEQIKFLYIKPEMTQLFGKKIINGDLYKSPLITEVKKFIASQQKIPSKTLQQWANDMIVVEEDNIEENNDDSEYADESENDDQENIETPDDFFPIPTLDSSKSDYRRTHGLTNYDITTTKPLSFEDVRKITINIARAQLTPIVEKDATMLQLEANKRKELNAEIAKYRNIKEIAAIGSDDISQMTLVQLEELCEKCKKAYESRKLLTAMQKGGRMINSIFSAICPNGIRVSKDKNGNEKYLKFNGALNEITNQMFNPTTCIGVAASNIIQQSNLHISDSVLTVIAIGEIILSKMQVVEIKNPNYVMEQPVQNINSIKNEVIPEIDDKNNEYETTSAYEEEEEYTEVEQISS